MSRLESALYRTESDAQATLKVASTVVSKLKKFLSFAKEGNLQELKKSIEEAEVAISALRQQFSNAKDNWDFDEESYFNGREFISEILETAKQKELKIFEQDDRLYFYPFIIRKSVNDRSVLIDKKKEKRLRPSVLVRRLKEMQNRPIRFRPETFLECLYAAYSHTAQPGQTIKLIKLYNLLTLLPGQSKEYSKPEFGRDIYLLDKSGVNQTRNGLYVGFPASTGIRSSASVITVITQEGIEKKYYGIKFYS